MQIERQRVKHDLLLSALIKCTGDGSISIVFRTLPDERGSFLGAKKL